MLRLEATKPIGLLISWAIPAESWPMEAIFSDCSNCIWAHSSCRAPSSIWLTMLRLDVRRRLSRAALASSWARMRDRAIAARTGLWMKSAAPSSKPRSSLSSSWSAVTKITGTWRVASSAWSLCSTS